MTRILVEKSVSQNSMNIVIENYNSKNSMDDVMANFGRKKKKNVTVSTENGKWKMKA